MYSLVLMTAMTASAPEAANWGWRHHAAACYGCSCYGCFGSCHGCYGGFLGCYGNCLGCWGAWAQSWGCHGCYGASLGYHGTVAIPAYYERALGGWGANYSYSASYPGMPPSYIPGTTKPKTPTSTGDKSARLILEVPGDAKVYVDGQLTKGSAEQRQFYTPALEPGQAYYYDVKVEVTQDGKPIVEEKRVIVKAGDIVHESFQYITARQNLATASRK